MIPVDCTTQTELNSPIRAKKGIRNSAANNGMNVGANVKMDCGILQIFPCVSVRNFYLSLFEWLFLYKNSHFIQNRVPILVKVEQSLESLQSDLYTAFNIFCSF